MLIENNIFTFIHLTLGFIQSNFHGIHFYVFPWITIHDLAVASAMLYQAAELQELNLIYWIWFKS